MLAILTTRGHNRSDKLTVEGENVSLSDGIISYSFHKKKKWTPF